MFGCHLQDYNRAKELMEEEQMHEQTIWKKSDQLWSAYSSVAVPHLALTSEPVEMNYIRTMADLLLHVLVPSQHIETNSGRFVVGELITCNVLLPLIAKLSDPDWLNCLLIIMCGNSDIPNHPTATESHQTSTPLETLPAQSDHVPPHDTADGLSCEVLPPRAGVQMFIATDMTSVESPADEITGLDEVDCLLSSAEEESIQNFFGHYSSELKSNPFYQESDSELDPAFVDYRQTSTDSFIMTAQQEGLCDKLADSDIRAKSVISGGLGEMCVGYMQNLERESCCHPKAPQEELLLCLEHSSTVHPEELNVSPSQSLSQLPSFSFEPLSSPDGPVIIQNLRITGTITAKEHRGTGSHPYTLYTVKVRITLQL